ncbi:hypothetical protein CKO12_13930 [Chromatium okenii]|uniref:hypothetical protein n=1 Tax=Chromatium okenii TaxID=61644 RepID=UPI001905CA96|nr:hypothetical protein [Chromatium okenii]MBK1642947.1 hypothetical protein [Chromatium okenii]
MISLPSVDPNALRQFAEGAKAPRPKQEPAPWLAFSADDLQRHSVSIRLNEYQLTMLRFIAEQNDVSQQKILNRIVIPELVKQAEELFEG